MWTCHSQLPIHVNLDVFIWKYHLDSKCLKQYRNGFFQSDKFRGGVTLRLVNSKAYSHHHRPWFFSFSTLLFRVTRWLYLFQASYLGNIKSRDSTFFNVSLGILSLFQDIQTPALVWTESHVKPQINHLKKEQLHPDCLKLVRTYTWNVG